MFVSNVTFLETDITIDIQNYSREEEDKISRYLLQLFDNEISGSGDQALDITDQNLMVRAALRRALNHFLNGKNRLILFQIDSCFTTGLTVIARASKFAV